MARVKYIFTEQPAKILGHGAITIANQSFDQYLFSGI